MKSPRHPGTRVSDFDERHALLHARVQFFVLCHVVPTFELASREPRSGGLYVGAVHAACHMARSEELSRLSIVQAMTDALEPLSFVHAFYEGGAAAFHRIDA